MAAAIRRRCPLLLRSHLGAPSPAVSSRTVPQRDVHTTSQHAGLWRAVASPLGADAHRSAPFIQRGAATATQGQADLSQAVDFLTSLRQAEPDEEHLKQFDEMAPLIQSLLVESSMNECISVLEVLSHLGSFKGRPYPISPLLLRFLEVYIEQLPVLAEEEKLSDRADSIRKVICSFHRAGVKTERVRLLYDHIERDFPQIEATGDLLPMPTAVRLCHAMLATGFYAAPAVLVLLRSALREPLMNYADDSVELRLLKMIEMLLRVEYVQTQALLSPEVNEYLSVVRSLRYYDRAIRRDTALSYQLAFFLRKHGFPAKRVMVGPYALKVCDPVERINFEPLEHRTFRSRLDILPTDRKLNHLKEIGWRSFEVKASDWHAMDSYEAKAAYVRSILKENELLAP